MGGQVNTTILKKDNSSMYFITLILQFSVARRLLELRVVLKMARVPSVLI
jgi:hypothetical protein